MKDYNIKVGNDGIKLTLIGSVNISTSNDSGQTVINISKANEKQSSVIGSKVSTPSSKECGLKAYGNVLSDRSKYSEMIESGMTMLEMSKLLKLPFHVVEKNVNQYTDMRAQYKEVMTRNLTDESRMLLELINSGLTIKEIAKELGVTYETICRRFARLRVNVRYAEARYKKNILKNYNKYLELIERGLTIEHISQALNLTYNTVRRKIHILGLGEKYREVKTNRSKASKSKALKLTTGVKGKTTCKKATRPEGSIVEVEHKTAAETMKDITEQLDDVVLTPVVKDITKSKIHRKVRKLILDKMTKVAMRKELGISYKRLNVIIDECGLEGAVVSKPKDVKYPSESIEILRSIVDEGLSINVMAAKTSLTASRVKTILDNLKLKGKWDAARKRNEETLVKNIKDYVKVNGVSNSVTPMMKKFKCSNGKIERILKELKLKLK